MSLVSIRPYFVTRMKSLGYHEHNETQFNNISENKFNKTFHLDIGDVANRGNGQRSLELSCPVTVRAFYKGSNSESARDKALEGMDAIITDLLNPVNRLNVSGLANVTFQSGKRDPYSDSNDQDAMLTLSFTAFVIYGT